MGLLRIGHHDRGSSPDSWLGYLRHYHEGGMRVDAFRGDKNGQWFKPSQLDGSPVAELQQALKSLGYLPQGDVDGIFGYRTSAAVRLFQEYMRTCGGNPGLGSPDGIVGKNTRRALEDAQSNDLKCHWTTTRQVNDEAWPSVLAKAQQQYALDYQRMLPQLFDTPSDTLPPSDWTIDGSSPQLIGIRRAAWAESLDGAGRRLNNDVFIVRFNRQTMRCFGSTDPNPRMSTNPEGIPFLCKGQHSYRFGYHRLKDHGVKCYRALRPAGAGVRVVRDTNRDKQLSKGDQLDASLNPTINLHWSGRGTSNWSAGCQVIGGALYIDDKGQTVDCWAHASAGYAGLGSRAGRGAYDVMLSLITVCAPDISKSGRVRYTLLEEADLKRFSPELHRSILGDFATAARTVASHDAALRRLIQERAPTLLA